MLISLQELEARDVRFKVELAPGEIDYDSKITQTSDLHAQGVAELISRSLGEIRVKGQLKVTVNGSCDRCLEPAAIPIDNAFDLVYVPADESRGGGEKEIDEAAIEVGFYEGAALNLNDVLREVVLLALPMQLTCSEDCKGICSVCGQNRNQGNCDCKPEPLDDRWSKLKSLRAEMGPQS